MNGSKGGWGRRLHDSSVVVALKVELELIVVSQLGSRVLEFRKAVLTKRLARDQRLAN